MACLCEAADNNINELEDYSLQESGQRLDVQSVMRTLGMFLQMVRAPQV